MSNIGQFKLRSQAKTLIAKLEDPAQKLEWTNFIESEDCTIEALKDVIIELEKVLAGDVETHVTQTKFVSEFGTCEAALKYLNETIYPAITNNIRLFKSEGGKQDEFIFVNRDWIKGDDKFQIYSKQGDIVDRLASIGIPVTVYYIQSNGDKKTRVKIDVLTEWKRTATTQDLRLNAQDYVPGGAPIVGHAFNTYKDVSVQAVEGIDVSGFIKHVTENLCNGHQEYADYLIKWIAHMVQKPQDRPMTGVALIGEEGNGKGIFVDLIAKMMGGPRNTNTTPTAADTEKFNTTVGGKLFLVFDEATFSGNHNQSDFMKKLVTEPMVRIEGKGRDAYQVKNYARTLITSNNMESAVPATIGARRWLIIETKNGLLQTELREMANSFGLNGDDHPNRIKDFEGGLKHYLQTFDISDFNPQLLPMQDTGMDTKIRNTYKTDPVFAFLCEWLGSPNLQIHRHRTERDPEFLHIGEASLEWENEVKFADFKVAFEAACKDAMARPTAHNQIGKKLANYGINVKAGSGNVRYLELPHPAKLLNTIRAKSRWDKIVGDDQELAINGWGSQDMIDQVQMPSLRRVK